MADEPAPGAAAASEGAAPVPAVDVSTTELPAPAGTQGASDSSDEPVLRSREAANYRARLRETEAENAALRVRLDQRDRADVGRIAAAALRDVDDLWSAVRDVSELRDDEGQIDPAKVETAIAALIERKPHFAVERHVPDFDAGVRAGSMPAAPSFGAALKHAARNGSR